MTQVQIPLESLTSKKAAIKDAVRDAVEADNPSSLKKVGITTMGCKVNTYESELIAQSLQTCNWQLVNADQHADLYLINTCTVTKEADRQARQQVRKVIKRNPDALVVVTGCYAQMDAQACADIPGVDLVLGNDRKLDVHTLLPDLQAGALPKVLVGDLDEQISLPDALLTGFEAHTRAFVQIQQGCDQGCTFCIIHRARGPSRSLSPTLIKRQVQRLVLNGYPEIVICGVDLGAYGADFLDAELPKYGLSDLLRDILSLEYDADNPFRIRLSSIDPVHISDELIDLIATEPRICPQLHLSLQSGDTLILKRMKRRYSAEFAVERIRALRDRVPQLTLSADVMVGFPTETEAQFDNTLRVCRQLDIAFPHVFSYSKRSGTPAARIPDDRQVSALDKKRRSQALRALGDKLKQALLQRKVGTTDWVLPEKWDESEQAYIAKSEDYSPVKIPFKEVVEGKWTKLQYRAVNDGYLIGFPIR